MKNVSKTILLFVKFEYFTFNFLLLEIFFLNKLRNNWSYVDTISAVCKFQQFRCTQIWIFTCKINYFVIFRVSYLSIFIQHFQGEVFLESLQSFRFYTKPIKYLVYDLIVFAFITFYVVNGNDFHFLNWLDYVCANI